LKEKKMEELDTKLKALAFLAANPEKVIRDAAGLGFRTSKEGHLRYVGDSRRCADEVVLSAWEVALAPFTVEEKKFELTGTQVLAVLGGLHVRTNTYTTDHNVIDKRSAALVARLKTCSLIFSETELRELYTTLGWCHHAGSEAYDMVGAILAGKSQT
jgi:hypothetical protein